MPGVADLVVMNLGQIVRRAQAKRADVEPSDCARSWDDPVPMTVTEASDDRLVKLTRFPGNVTICLTGVPPASVNVLMISTPSIWPRIGSSHWWVMTKSPCVCTSRTGCTADAGAATVSTATALDSNNDLRSMLPSLGPNESSVGQSRA